MKTALFLIFTLQLFGGVGEFLAVRGEVKLNEDDAKVGMVVQNRDVVKTQKGKAQIQLFDKTTIQIGKNSIFEISDYKKNRTLSVPQGLFSVVTGKMRRFEKSKFKLKTKTSTIGIRGTHFGGSVSKNSETMFCLDGSIIISLSDEVIELQKGEMIKVENGTFQKIEKFKLEKESTLEELLKLSPEFLRKLENLDFEAQKNLLDSSSNGYARSEIFRDIREMEGDLFYIAQQEYIDEMLKETHENAGTPIDMSFLFPTGSENIDSWGFFSKEGASAIEIANGNSLFTPFGESKILDRIELLWVGESEVTPYNVMADKIGYFDEEILSSVRSWDGRSVTKEMGRYKGKVFGLTHDYIGNFSFIENGDFEIVVDFGNQFSTATTTFNDEYKEWYFQVGNIKNKSVNITGLQSSSVGVEKGDNFFSIASNLYDGRFFGVDGETFYGVPSAQSLFLGVDISGKEFYEMYQKGELEYGDFYGSIDNLYAIAIADRTEKVLFSKEEIGENDYFKWGYWSSEDEVESLPTKSGAWIIPKVERSEVQDFDLRARYKGSVFGTVHYPFENRDTEIVQNGKIELDIGVAGIFGKIDFNAGEDSWKIYIESGWLSTKDTDFLFDNIAYGVDLLPLYYDTKMVTSSGGTVSDGDVINQLDGSGNFYGESSELIGGGFSAGTENGKYVIGAFTGEKFDEYDSWGEWSEFSDSYELFREITPFEVIDDFKNYNLEAKYRGDLQAENIENGELELDIDFGQMSVSGNMNFLLDSEEWNIDFENGGVGNEADIWLYSESGSITKGDEVVDSVNRAGMVGNFYGKSGEFVKGEFVAESVNEKFVDGSFIGSRE